MDQTLENRIRERAYEMWTAHGCVHGKRSSTGLRLKGNSWRHRWQFSPANQIRRRIHGRPHVRRPPERSRGLADAADVTVNPRSARKAATTLANWSAIRLLKNLITGIVRVAIRNLPPSLHDSHRPPPNVFGSR
jgi:hypothetical protein